MNIGLKPANRISYQIENDTRLPGIDSAAYIYQGNGGVWQAYLGVAAGTKNFSVAAGCGVNIDSAYLDACSFKVGSFKHARSWWVGHVLKPHVFSRRLFLEL